MARAFSFGRMPSWQRYLAAVVITAALVTVRLALSPVLHSESPLMILVLAVMISAYIGGLGPGLLATALTALAGVYLFLEPVHSLRLAYRHDQIRVAVFLLVGVFISLLSHAMHLARRRSEHSARRVADILSSITDCYFAMDRDGRVLEMNERAAHYFRLQPEQIVGHNFWQLMSCCRGSPLEQQCRKALDEHTPVHFEAHSCILKGTWAEIHAYPAPHGLSIYFRDISQRREMEAAVRESESRFQELVRNIDAVFWMAEWRKPEILYMSPAYEKVWGRPIEGIRADPRDWMEGIHPEDRDRVEASVRSHPSGQPFELQYRVVRPDGSIRWIRSRAFPIRGQPLRIAGIAEDVTELQAAAEALREAKEEAEAANRAKDQFLATLSHELRTPLTPVLGSISLMEGDSRLPADLRDDVQMIHRNIALEARLIDDMLDLTRIARGKIEMHPASVDMHALLDHAVRTCREDAVRKRQRIIVEPRAANPCVWADAARLEQVFWNLINNATKFTPEEGTITIRTRNQEQGEVPSGPVLVVEVQDTGAGIEPGALERIFDAFQQQGRIVTRRYGGLGLGLAICRAIVTMHGGTIRAHSRGPGTGATFSVELPVHTPAAPVPPPPQAPAPLETRDGPAASGRKSRILLVEDHADTARIMSHVLESQGHEVRIAGDVASALRLAEQEHFELIVSDLGLPDGNGLDLMQRLAAARPAMKGIALSGYGMEEDVQRSREAGFAEHLTKPVDLDRLEAAIERVAGG